MIVIKALEQLNKKAEKDSKYNALILKINANEILNWI